MIRAIVLDTDEWAKIAACLQAARVISLAADNGRLRGAIDRSTENGKALLYFVRDLDIAAKELPDTVELPEVLLPAAQPEQPAAS